MVLEGTALAKAAASPELAALRAAVTSKDSALALAWRGRVGNGGGDSGGGWGSPFATPPPTTWEEAVALGRGGGGEVVVAAWKTWRASVTGLVSGMEGVLDGLIGASPSVRSSLEGYLEIRFDAVCC